MLMRPQQGRNRCGYVGFLIASLSHDNFLSNAMTLPMIALVQTARRCDATKSLIFTPKNGYKALGPILLQSQRRAHRKKFNLSGSFLYSSFEVTWIEIRRPSIWVIPSVHVNCWKIGGAWAWTYTETDHVNMTDFRLFFTLIRTTLEEQNA